MTTIDLSRTAPRAESASPTPSPPDTAPTQAARPVGNPGTVGLPVAIAGATGLFVVNAGWLPAGATAATVSILIGSTGVGLLVAAVWAAALGENASASIFGSFSGFYLSYTALVLGQDHDWFGPSTDSGRASTETFLIAWLVVFAVLTLVTLRLPLAFTITFAAVVVALAFLLLGVAATSTVSTRVGAAAVLVFLATVVWVYADAMLRETGGAGLPLGRPVLGRG